uniref:Zinc finger and BTB domain containing 6 n=1 Tax=Gasterosteus aculeatus aculeatus TaxID=481459 RepID=A0AAQ4RPX4_GASAC
MSSSRDTLRFRFPAHGDSILSKINTLRQEQRFCDVTLLLGDPRDASGQPLHFHAHRAVLAVSSDFLRDQFLLHGGRAKLCVGVVCCAEVGKRLLLSCYTGLLEVPLRDLVSYLTAASALQMSQVVERCSQAISQYLGPTLALKPAERHSEEKDNQQPDSDQPGTSSGNQEEKDALLASIRQREEGKLFLLEAQPQECGEPRDTHLFSIPGENLPKSFCLSGDELEGRSDSTSSQRPYLCRRCDRVFQHLESYLGHLKPHRQYLCLVCGKGFSQRINLVRHIRAHTGVKPFRCPLCHKTFSQKATLQDHFNLHTGDQSHKCRYCGVLFQHKVGLRRHLKDIHGSGPQNND